MQKLGVPCVPGSDGVIKDLKEAKKIAEKIGFPLIVKASAGGGGRGMKLVLNSNNLESAFKSAKKEAMQHLEMTMFIERYLTNPKHIEIQIIGDGKGNAVHLAERDCSIQRRHQKILEEAPSTILNNNEINDIGKICVNAISKLKYSGVVQLNFHISNSEFYFIADIFITIRYNF